MSKKLPRFQGRQCDYCGSLKVQKTQLIEIKYLFNEDVYFLYCCKNEKECEEYKKKVIESKMFYSEDEFVINIIKKFRLKHKFNILLNEQEKM